MSQGALDEPVTCTEFTELDCLTKECKRGSKPPHTHFLGLVNVTITK